MPILACGQDGGPGSQPVQVRLSFNDLLAVAERQDAPKGVSLRVINRLLMSTFSAALEQ